ncbi:MAG TPA: coenzyme A pyrophosphatase [Flavobacteriales bacterium]|nr:coenzyme A pyrophosphatase [Flavobacteriales bacterium]
MHFDDFLLKINSSLVSGLPGEIAQLELAPLGRGNLEESMKNAQNPKYSAVLAMAYPIDSATNICFIERKAYPGVHSGQIGFPGGKREEEDNDLMQTALRETLEEVGVEVSPAQVLGQLSPLYIPPSNFFVQPFIAALERQPKFIADEIEVERVLEFSLQELLDERNLIDTQVSVGEQGFKLNTRAFRIGEHIIWGATAMMVSEIRYMLR